MFCAEFEILLSGYVDNTLSNEERGALEQHARVCQTCGELLKDVMDAVGVLRKAEKISPPAELITRIAYQIPMGRAREPLERQGMVSKLFGNWLRPFLQPRFAMGMAMTILSFAMLERCTGVQVQHIRPNDLSPVKVWGNLEDKVVRTKDRAIKYYENLRFVYEIEAKLKDLKAQQDAVQDRESTQAPQAGNGTESKPAAKEETK